MEDGDSNAFPSPTAITAGASATTPDSLHGGGGGQTLGWKFASSPSSYGAVGGSHASTSGNLALAGGRDSPSGGAVPSPLRVASPAAVGLGLGSAASSSSLANGEIRAGGGGGGGAGSAALGGTFTRRFFCLIVRIFCFASAVYASVPSQTYCRCTNLVYNARPINSTSVRFLTSLACVCARRLVSLYDVSSVRKG